MTFLTETISSDYGARLRYSTDSSSYSPYSVGTMKRSPSLSSAPTGNSYKSYTNAIAEYTATVERLRSRRNSMQDASTARRDSSLRASSSNLDRLGLPAASTPPSSRRPAYSSSTYVAPSLPIVTRSDYLPRSRSSLSVSSSANSSAYADRIISRVDKLLSQHYSAADAEAEKEEKSASTARSKGRTDDDANEPAGYRRSSYLKALAATDTSPSADYSSNYATLPNRRNKTYSREESLEKAREILAANTGRPKIENDDTSSVSSYSSRRSQRDATPRNEDLDSGVESFASSRAASFERSRSCHSGFTNGYTSRHLNGIQSTTASRLASRETSPIRAITRETDKTADPDSNTSASMPRPSKWESERRLSREHRLSETSDKEQEISSSLLNGGYRARLERLTRANSGLENGLNGHRDSVSPGKENEGEATLDWTHRGARGRSPVSKATSRSMQPRRGVAVDDTDKAGLVGLKNIGNTCFMNSILQCLSNTKSLRDYCTSGQYEPELNASSSHRDGPLISAFATVLEALWKRHSSYSSSNAYDPDRFHRKIQQYAPRFSGYLQQDAQEFLRYLLEGLHEDVNRVTVRPKPEMSDISDHLDDAQKSAEAWKRYLKRDNSKIVEMYVGQLKSSLTCENCGNCSVTYDPFWDLALPIPGYRSSALSDSNIYDCLKFFTKKEIMDGDERPTCSKCKSRQRCTKNFSIQRFPLCLVIHLKRFSQERYRAKISSLVDYPVDGLDLSPYAADSYTGPRPRYNLFAVSCHAGSTHCGHYTAFCKHPVSGKWNEYNDSRVSPASAREVVTSDAYVLFYELVG